MSIETDKYNRFMIRMEGFQEAHQYHELFPDCRALPEHTCPYLRSSFEAQTFFEGSAAFYRSLADLDFGGQL